MTESRIMGYGRSYWSIVQVKKSGWLQEDGGWRYYLGNTGQPVRNDWVYADGKWYGFAVKVTNTWYQHKGDCYYPGADEAMEGIASFW
ncbi:MAG: hypothetical protein LBQ71_20625 [Hungatella sp.]|nr:hypothetical protein [Hungatella sp.]